MDDDGRPVRGQPLGGGADVPGSAGDNRAFARELQMENHGIYVSIGT